MYDYKRASLIVFLLLDMMGYGLGEIVTPKKAKVQKGSGEQKMKEVKEWKYVNQFLNMERNIQEQQPEFGKDVSKEEKERRLYQMYQQFPRHSRSVIKKSLKKYRYNMSETYDYMIKQPQMAEEKPQIKQDNAQKTHVLPSQVCDQFQEENIRGEEFQQIFTVVRSKQRSRPRDGFKMRNAARKEKIDQDLIYKTLKEIRDEIDHLYKYRKEIQIMNGNRRNYQNQQHRRMINQINPRIASLSHASRILQIEQMEEQNPLFINLHGYRQQQIPQLFKHIVQMLRENPQVENSARIATLVAITGKGIHSPGQRSALKPVLKAWCDQNGFESNEKSDRLLLLIPLQ